MPRLPSLRRRGPTADAGQPPEPRPVRRRLPPPSQLRRDRRTLLRAREQRLRDLGGLLVEMYRRDQFRQDLLVDRCAELAHIDERIGEIDALLATAAAVRRRPAARCECGATILWGSRFCSTCGRDVAGAAAS